MSDILRWGILGASKFAFEHMLPAMQLAKNNICVALATRDKSKAMQFLQINPEINIYNNYDSLLNDPNIDAIYIPLPNHLHIEWSRKALKAGKHVLCEKPISLNANEIDELIELRDETGLLVAEAYMILHHPQWIYAKKLLDSGVIGNLIQVDGVFSYNNSDDQNNIRNSAKTGGGSLLDIGVYTFGSTRFMTGEDPEEITQTNILWENKVDVWASVSAKFSSFQFLSVTSMRMHPRQEMNFHGSKGIISLSSPFNPKVFGEAEVHLCLNQGDRKTVKFTSENHYVMQLEAFNTSVRDGSEYACSLEFAKGTQQMIDMVFEHQSNKKMPKVNF